MGETYDRMFAHVFTPILERFQVREQDRNYIMAFYIRGLIAIITEWINRDCSDSTENIISVIRRCVIPLEHNKDISVSVSNREDIPNSFEK